MAACLLKGCPKIPTVTIHLLNDFQKEVYLAKQVESVLKVIDPALLQDNTTKITHPTMSHDIIFFPKSRPPHQTMITKPYQASRINTHHKFVL